MGTASKLLERLRRLAARRLLACLVMGLLPMALRLAVLGYAPIPEPAITDEFSYLLGADTFASGRLTNPRHPMWVHFESYSVLSSPTYASRYPPAPALFMGAGEKFLGHPWLGVWLSFGLLCFCLCWMLQAWMPPLYALLGTLVAIGQIGIFGYWMDSYWGGAVAGAGGCLVLGALPRLALTSSGSAALAGSLGVTILAFCRPLEGLVLLVAVLTALIVWRLRRGRKLSNLLVPAVIIPVVTIGSLSAAAMAYYNYRVTGNALLLPYVLFERTYARTPLFLFLPLRNIPNYHHEEMRQAWDLVSVPLYHLKRRQPWRNLAALQSFLSFYMSGLVVFVSSVGALFCSSARLKAAAAILAPLILMILLEVGPHAHYLAPVCGLFFVVAMCGIRLVALRARQFGPVLLLLFVGLAFGQGLIGVFPAHQPEITPRVALEKQLIRSGGQHLVFVHYNPAKPIHATYVYNRADIDRSAVVWAHDMGEEKNRELLNYYPHRTVWRLQTDLANTLLTPYPVEADSLISHASGSKPDRPTHR